MRQKEDFLKAKPIKWKLPDIDLLLVYNRLAGFNLYVCVWIYVTLKLGTETFLTFLKSFLLFFA